MAIFMLSAKIVSRSKGQSVIASAAYRAGEKLADPNRLQDHDYTNRRGIEHTEIMAPANAPAWLQVARGNKDDERIARQELWQRVETSERKRNSQLAREITIALPHELNAKQRLELVREFVERNFTSLGMVADVALHAPEQEGGKNYHAHILLTMRELTPVGFAKHKNRDWNDRDMLQGWREHWCSAVNRHLQRAGREERVDHRSNKERGIDREPQPKLGPVAHEIEKAGGKSLAGDDIRSVKERNLLREVLELGTRAVDRMVDNYHQAEHVLAKELSLQRLERLLDEIADRLVPDVGLNAPTERAAEGATKGLSRAADSALNVMGGVLSFFDPSPAPKQAPNIEERIVELEALRDRFLRDEHDRMRAQQHEAARALEAEQDHTRGRERERYK